MANKHHCCGKDQCDHDVQIQQLTLDDGRHAERHISFDEDGNEIVEIFAEEKRPKKLEKRIVREHKKIVSKETHELVRDGEVIQREIVSRDSEPPMQIRERIGVADHAKVVDGDYVRKEEMERLVADAVVTGVSALMENMEPVVHNKNYETQDRPVMSQPMEQQPQPVFTAQQAVEENVAEKKKNDGMLNIVMAGILIAQVAFFGYMFFVM